MLYDTIMHSSSKPIQNYAAEFEVFDAEFKGKLAESQRFVVSRDVLTAVHHVAQIKPASVLTALNMVRPAYRFVWCEWAEDDYLHTAGNVMWGNYYDELASKRRGVFIADSPDRCSCTAIPVQDMKHYPGHWMASPMCGVLARAADSPDYSTSPENDPWFRQLLKFCANIEPAAREALCRSIRPRATPGFPLQQDPRSYSWMDMNACHYRMRFAQALLIMLNTKNAVETVLVDLVGLNRARAKRGKPPLADYRITTLKLSAARKRAAAAAGMSEQEMRVHWCRGHFKVRKTGVFWWSPHIRGHQAPALHRPHYQVVN